MGDARRTTGTARIREEIGTTRSPSFPFLLASRSARNLAFQRDALFTAPWKLIAVKYGFCSPYKSVSPAFLLLPFHRFLFSLLSVPLVSCNSIKLCVSMGRVMEAPTNREAGVAARYYQETRNEIINWNYEAGSRSRRNRTTLISSALFTIYTSNGDRARAGGCFGAHHTVTNYRFYELERNYSFARQMKRFLVPLALYTSVVGRPEIVCPRSDFEFFAGVDLSNVR